MADSLKKLSIGLLYDDSVDSSDGVAHQVKLLGSWLTSRGHKVVYLCGESKTANIAGAPVYSLAKNLKVKFNHNRLSIPLISRASQIDAVLKKEELQVIHVQMPYSPLMAQRVIKRAYKNSVVVSTFHIFPSGLMSSIGSRVLAMIQYFSYRKITTKLAVSSAASNFAKNNYGITTEIIPNMVSLDKLKTNYQPKGQNNIVFLGRLVDRKGCKQLIEALSLVISQIPSATLTIAGDGPQRQALERLAIDLDVADKVNFLGFVSETEKAKLLGQADLACFPSLYGESFGIVLIEAMAAGSSVVLGGNNPGYESVLSEQPKLLVNPNDKTAFASRIVELLTDKKLIKAVNDWQQKSVKKYDVEVVGQRLETVYAEAFAKHAHSRHNDNHERR